MRIISGEYKGKRLTAPKSLPVRPTTDFAKEALFNILNHRIDFDDVDMLDLFAGTGNISYEFASRGAKQITSVDADFGCIKFISKTAEDLEFPIRAIKSDVYKYLTSAAGTFDLVFADPPYAFTMEQMDSLVQSLYTNNWVNEDGMVIIEHTKHIDLSSILNFTEARKYGGSVFSFFQK
ncbi:MAG: 16S rRNA (guanine966-N2)-methyltransferase [Sediminicola sp.]|jgi:16S rRNA (guanine(966)-N(2))-methyltransferase RsmD|tara:strand:+ start:2319 stop:2855 length:537 start_codon:yes stop_codon:yes gene_type:complete